VLDAERGVDDVEGGAADTSRSGSSSINSMGIEEFPADGADDNRTTRNQTALAASK